MMRKESITVEKMLANTSSILFWWAMSRSRLGSNGSNILRLLFLSIT